MLHLLFLNSKVQFSKYNNFLVMMMVKYFIIHEFGLIIWIYIYINQIKINYEIQFLIKPIFNDENLKNN